MKHKSTTEENSIKTKYDLEKEITKLITEFFNNTGVIVVNIACDPLIHTCNTPGKRKTEIILSELKFTME